MVDACDDAEPRGGGMDTCDMTGPWPTSVLFTVKVSFGAALPHRRAQRVANLRGDKQAFLVNRGFVAQRA